MTSSPRPLPRYSAGSAYAVVAAGGLALLPAECDDALADAVWTRLDGGAGLGGVLDALTARYGANLAALPPFALVTFGEQVRVLVRGQFEAVVTDEQRQASVVSGVGVTTWAERVVSAMDIELREATDGAPAAVDASPLLPLRDGIVRAGRIRFAVQTDAAAPGAPEAPAAPPAVASPPLDAAPVAWVPTAWTPAPAPTGEIDLDVDEPTWVSSTVKKGTVGKGTVGKGTVADGGGAPAAEEHSADLFGDTLLTPRAGRSPGAPAPTPAPAPADAEESAEIGTARVADAAMDAGTVAGTVAGGATGEVDAAELSALMQRGDHDGATISLAEHRALLAQSEPSLPPTPHLPPPPPLPGRIELSTGRTVLLDRAIVVGRRPRATRAGEGITPQLITVDSPNQDISRSHLEIRREGETVVAVDLDTTNGTVLHRDGAHPVRLHPGEATLLVDGDTLDLGDDITATYREA